MKGFAVKRLHSNAACLPLFSPTGVGAVTLCAVATLHIAWAHRFAFDAVTVDELKHQVATAVAKLQETLAPVRAQLVQDFLWWHAGAARIDLPAVSA